MTLAEQILVELKAKPDQKASDLAHVLSVERREINRCLSHDLAGKVQQDSGYRWRLRDTAARSAAGGASTPQAPLSELARLCRYYLECIGQDEEGVSAFAASKYGEPDYAELPAAPVGGAEWDWWNVSGTSRILGKVRAERGKLIAYLGYPVRLRRHRTARWEGFFVEPVMLWPIALPENPGDPYRLQDALPTPNFKFLRSLAMGDPSQIMEEAASLASDLGLDNPLDEQPEADELLQRLAAVRPDWDWREAIDPEHCSQGPALAELSEVGIYNRAVIIAGERSPYTQGLESELKLLSEKNEAALNGTALGAWLAGRFDESAPGDDEPLVEVLPMNTEQREAVRSALTAPLTVVTGPPGTGKSQVVTNLLVNAAWRGKKVVFASKNNKAVDVVEARVNGLGNRPVLLRLGSKEYQAKLADYMAAMLSGAVSLDDEQSYKEGVERHRLLAARIKQLDAIQEATLNARNQVDQLDSIAEDYRVLFGSARFNALDEQLVKGSGPLLEGYAKAANAADPSRQTGLGRLVWWVLQGGRRKALEAAAERVEALAAHLGVALPKQTGPDVGPHHKAVADLRHRVEAAGKVLAYQHALEVLRSNPSFEDIARQRQELSEQVAQNSAGLWRDFVQLTPSRLTAAQRKDIADYAALLQLMLGPDASNIAWTVKKRANELQSKVSALFSCWAVTSLSARGKLPFEAAHFDLVVIDEASQCDIASALPLLFRAKRAVIIGDPMQLRHISALSRQKESELQQKYSLIETRASWMYSVNSLFDLAAGLASSRSIVNLRDHHRSHADIIEFSNREFYGGKLRVATRYDRLKRPSNKEPGIVWEDVRGRIVRPASGGAENSTEAKAVIAALRDLLIERGYEGSVGVVTPFRAQAQLLQKLVQEDRRLPEAASRSELLVDTVHRFQGDERDVMFFSPVISMDAPAGALGFLRSNGNLFNVAITRARGLLHVVGDRAAAVNSGVDYLADFAAYTAGLAAPVHRDPVAHKHDFGPDYPTVARPEQVSDWERLFYRELYRNGLRPIPQFSVEQYDLDFALFVGDRRLNIEVDGERYHRSWTGELCLRDQLRNQRLIELGWEVRRFWVYEIRDRMEECVAWIRDWADAAEEPETRRSQAELRASANEPA